MAGPVDSTVQAVGSAADFNREVGFRHFPDRLEIDLVADSGISIDQGLAEAQRPCQDKLEIGLGEDSEILIDLESVPAERQRYPVRSVTGPD